MPHPAPSPTEIRLRQAEKRLEITYDDGQTFSLPAEYLRVESPSAEVQGHGPDQRRLVAGRRHVGILRLEQDLADNALFYLTAGARDGSEDGIYGGLTVLDATTGDANGNALYVPRTDNNEALEAGLTGYTYLDDAPID